MNNKTNNNKVIAKNTIFLYIRTIVIMVIKLYTTRELLNVLGTDNFGIWNVVYGAVIAFSFINSPIITATQRFLNYDQGKGGHNQSKIFTTSLMLIIILSVILVIFFESIGLEFVKRKLEIPSSEETTTLIVYHCCIGILCFNLIRLPFEAIIISNEKFSFYAFISFIESGLLLLAVVILKIEILQNPLKLYGYFSLCIAVSLFLAYAAYTKLNFKEVHLEKQIDKSLIKDIGKFSGWNLFGSLASMTSNQGVNVLLNIFYGVAVNAAYGISMQVRSAFALITDNLIKAANPRIVKMYAQENNDEMMAITTNISKFSFLLIFTFSFILINFMDFVLQFWLGKNVPEYANVFCVLSIVQILIVCLASPIDTVIFATGDIKNYQLVISAVIFLNFVFSYLFLKIGMTPAVVLMVKCYVEFIVLIVRICFVKIKIDYPIKKYIKSIICPSLLIVLISFIGYVLIDLSMNLRQTFKDMVIFSCIYIPFIMLFSWYIYLTPSMRQVVKNNVLNKCHKMIKL